MDTNTLGGPQKTKFVQGPKSFGSYSAPGGPNCAWPQGPTLSKSGPGQRYSENIHPLSAQSCHPRFTVSTFYFVSSYLDKNLASAAEALRISKRKLGGGHGLGFPFSFQFMELLWILN